MGIEPKTITKLQKKNITKLPPKNSTKLSPGRPWHLQGNEFFAAWNDQTIPRLGNPHWDFCLQPNASSHVLFLSCFIIETVLKSKFLLLIMAQFSVLRIFKIGSIELVKWSNVLIVNVFGFLHLFFIQTVHLNSIYFKRKGFKNRECINHHISFLCIFHFSFMDCLFYEVIKFIFLFGCNYRICHYYIHLLKLHNYTRDGKRGLLYFGTYDVVSILLQRKSKMSVIFNPGVWGTSTMRTSSHVIYY